MSIKELEKYLCNFCHNIIVDPVYCVASKEPKHYFCLKCMEDNYGDDDSESKPCCRVCGNPNFSWKKEENTPFTKQLEDIKEWLYKKLRIDPKTLLMKNENNFDTNECLSTPQGYGELNDLEDLGGNGKIGSDSEEDDFAQPDEDGMISKPGFEEAYNKNVEEALGKNEGKNEIKMENKNEKMEDNKGENNIFEVNVDFKGKNGRFFDDYLEPNKGVNENILKRYRGGFNSNLGIYLCKDCITDKNGSIEFCKKCMKLNKQLYYLNDLDLINKEGRHCKFHRGEKGPFLYCNCKFDETIKKRDTHSKYITKKTCGKSNSICLPCQELRKKIDKYLSKEQVNYILDIE